MFEDFLPEPAMMAPDEAWVWCKGWGDAEWLARCQGVPEAETLALPLGPTRSQPESERQFAQGFPPQYIGLISYDDYTPHRESASSSQFFKVLELQRCGPRAPNSAKIQTLPHPTLRAQSSSETYLQNIDRIQTDIRAGRYYQLNYLRYYDLQWPQASVADFLDLARLRGGAFSSAIVTPYRMIVSLSPERFVALRPHGSGLLAQAQPIKGSIKRSCDEKEDRHLRATLQASTKDRAELAMIIDLMRNDLGRLSIPGQVCVTADCTTLSLPYVHHLYGTVQAALRPSLTLGDYLAALCPAGSITGAPKIEVMTAIQELEGRSRGYFMGNVVLFNPELGCLDSSVLIRTLVSDRFASPGSRWGEFAAGSGVVLASDPATELAEIAIKASVLGANYDFS